MIPETLEGYISFYRGINANLLGSGVNWGVYFFTYEFCKSNLPRLFTNSNDIILMFEDNNNNSTITSSKKNANAQANSFFHFVSGYIAGAVSVIMTNPIWMIKTRLQIQNEYKGFANCAIRVYREEGISKFYRGILPGLALCTNKAIQFTVYEKLKYFANLYYRHQNEFIYTHKICSFFFFFLEEYTYVYIKKKLEQ
ncbi:hypothetical protein RFI_10784 [Reticulomyxa filosa]|uniref:Mitochondrial carrier protein n=1 Tax=Reticulomyxa filosa TaxID=46433 RepID=X6NJ62_RETFI|nr:hypothetical protein RFI_10784 [Reticulomyxa filosa]|eukprot:ETO26355.1 hypothetical protein RFI_10784 [Reticulomyxa filosa]